MCNTRPDKMDDPEWRREMFEDSIETPPSREEEIERVILHDWVDILCESVSEADDSFLVKMQLLYMQGDHLLMGELLHKQITEYGTSVALAWGAIDE